ncbi:peptide ABC transporter permease [Virgibacillus phasianinus]|uniref:Peptide ABC transporter permease n=1 Tax=Virgibacillus phasianinus TaxID=2017483 RepID=A0A220U1G7_9BACI|nr:oligopeptide ABC transporter permease [Virgibacillus phasianinus]ASK61988.1 peptide ABC transporter permease [Virgibacillus phasianinus]
MDQNKLPKELFEPLEQNDDAGEKIAKPSRTFLQDATRTFLKNKLAIVSVLILIIIGIMSAFGPGMNEYGYNDQDVTRGTMPPRIKALDGIGWLGFDGTLSSSFEAENVEEATKDAYMRYDNKKEFIDIEVKDKGNGTADSAEVEATYHVYQAKDMDDTYFWLGTDNLGRDQWTRLWKGTRVSLYIAFLAAAIDLIIGVAYGGISGYAGGRVDNILQRIMEVLVGIPNLVVILLMIIILQPGILSITIALTITGWIGMARIVRGEIMKIKNMEYVLASRTLGTKSSKIITRHLLPNISGVIIINTMFTIPSAIFFEAFLSFIGLGLVPPEASLGTLINTGFDYIRIYPFLLLYPAIIISVIMIAFNIVADGLRDAFDPRMHK